jgi:hypothetical protein
MQFSQLHFHIIEGKKQLLTKSTVPSKVSFTHEENIKIFSTKQNERQFITTRTKF